ncbi:hypothetical protein [Longimicrobium sp.]|uniref:hypothetical protein n=1 Tax=Longimicrobium sp. TaxID=2029185 RepID=UPI003B3AD914
MLRLCALAAVAALLAAAPASAQAPADVPAAFRPRPLPAELIPEAAVSPPVELSVGSGRPVWLLPAVGLVAGAVLYPMLVDGGCDDRDCMLYVPEPVTGAIIGLLGGITVEVVLMAVDEAKDSDPAVAVPPG